MKYLQSWEIEGEDWGTQFRGEVIVNGEVQPPQGEAFFCSLCGRVWARASIIGQRWNVRSMLCGKHPHRASYSPSGSLYLGWDSFYMRAMPRKLLEREFHIMCNYFERE